MFQFLEETRLTTPVDGLRLAADMSYLLDVYAPLACISLSLSLHAICHRCSRPLLGQLLFACLLYVLSPLW